MNNSNKHAKSRENIKVVILKVFLYIIAVFFILSGLLYFDKITAPSILIIIAGILLIPPVGDKLIINKKYKLVKNIIIIILFMAFLVNVPVEEKTKNKYTQEAFAQNFIQEDNTENQIVGDSSKNVVQSTPTFSTGKYLGAFREDK